MDVQLRLRWRCAQAVPRSCKSKSTVEDKALLARQFVSWVMYMGYPRPLSWALAKLSFPVGTTALKD
jgi:hypothetical protein